MKCHIFCFEQMLTIMRLLLGRLVALNWRASLHKKLFAATLISIIFSATPAHAGFEEGLKYFEAKKYEKAYTEFLPLAN